MSYVNWFDAIDYCNWRSKQEGLQQVFKITQEGIYADWSAEGYRLPTEAEWEYAAREGGKKIRFGNGKDHADPKEINFNGSEEHKKTYSNVGVYRGKTIPVGSLKCQNALGLHDMSGNVFEWCWDWHSSLLRTENNPTGPENGLNRIIRGGAWVYFPSVCRTTCRISDTPDKRNDLTGFRLARNTRVS